MGKYNYYRLTCITDKIEDKRDPYRGKPISFRIQKQSITVQPGETIYVSYPKGSRFTIPSKHIEWYQIEEGTYSREVAEQKRKEQEQLDRVKEIEKKLAERKKATKPTPAKRKSTKTTNDNNQTE